MGEEEMGEEGLRLFHVNEKGGWGNGEKESRE